MRLRDRLAYIASPWLWSGPAVTALGIGITVLGVAGIVQSIVNDTWFSIVLWLPLFMLMFARPYLRGVKRWYKHNEPNTPSRASKTL